MKHTLLTLACAALLAMSFTVQAEEKWTVLFDGKKVSGLRGYGQKEFPEMGWKIVDGTLKTIPRNKGGRPRDLATEVVFKDFEFECEWKVSPGGNSGIMYRVKEQGRPAYFTGPELQVLDDERHADGRIRFPLRTAGSLYELKGKGMKEKPYNKAGEWNKVRIVFKDNQVEHWLNGAKIVEYTWGSDEIKALIQKSKFRTWKGFMEQPEGRIVIQHHGEEVWYRNIRVRKL
ncbi:MAG: hypothetical protein CMO66_05830 [Verrucomicrobiales bacterium]|nr:hypothetical protein [Verrucomicrobiales bacterium]